MYILYSQCKMICTHRRCAEAICTISFLKAKTRTKQAYNCFPMSHKIILFHIYYSLKFPCMPTF